LIRFDFRALTIVGWRTFIALFHTGRPAVAKKMTHNSDLVGFPLWKSGRSKAEESGSGILPLGAWTSSGRMPPPRGRHLAVAAGGRFK